MAIRNPLPYDHLRGSSSIDTSYYGPFDIQHVRSKFPAASRMIMERLGKSITDRRQYFKFRESHHKKIVQGLDKDFATGRSNDAGSTIASALPDGIKTTLASNVMSVVDEDNGSDSGISELSMASSGTDLNRLRIPPLPDDAPKGPFECPFCFRMISASTTLAWRQVYEWPESIMTED